LLAVFTSLPWDFVAVQNYRKNLFAGASSSQHCDKVGGGARLLQRERDRERRDGRGGGKERKNMCVLCENRDRD
jgi:hypothetical protein